MTVVPIPIVNAYWSNDSIVTVSRTAAGERKIKTYPAEYACFLRKSDITPATAAKLRAWPRLRGWREEGGWVRLQWRRRQDLREATSPSRYPHPVHGGTESLFDRLGLQVYEADVHPVRRWLTDHQVEIQAPHRCYLDLEVDSRVPFGRKEQARILSWAVTDDTGEWTGDVLAEDTDQAEQRLLLDLWACLVQYDQVCAWNGDRFDFPVLRARTEDRGIAVHWDLWLWLDHLELFRSMNMHVSESGDEKQSFALGRIATVILGETKDDLDASKSWDYWVAGGEDRELLFQYNVRDAELLRMIEAATGYIATQLVICQVCNTLPDSRGNNGTNFVEGYLLRMGLAEDRHFPTKWDMRAVERFEGAFVMEPTRRGILHGVHVADFSGMYPSIIQTWNISPETVRDDVVLQEAVVDRPVYLRHLPPQTFPLPKDVCSVPGGVCFQREPMGMIPRAIDELKRLRKVWADMKAAATPGTPEWHDADRKSNAYKVTANTFYGVMGAPSSRFYDKHTAGSVTAAGRWLIRKTIEAAEARGMAGIYGDTDSVFIADVTESVFRDFVGWCNATLYPGLLAELQCPTNAISIAYEKEFETIVLVGKKRYAGKFAHYKGKRATAESKPEIKGLEYKRGDSVRLARNLQYAVVQLLMAGCEDPVQYQTMVATWRDNVLGQPLDVREFMLAKTLTQDVAAYRVRHKKDGSDGAQPPHVEVAKILRARGVDTGAGARIEYVVTDGSVSPLRVMPVMDYIPGAEDRFYLWESLVWPPTERVLEVAFPHVSWHSQYGRVRPPKVKVPKTIPPKAKRQPPPGQGALFKE